MIKERINIWFLTAAVLIVSLQALLVMGLVASWLPAAYTWQTADFFPRGRVSFPREYDLLIFRAFILLNVLLALAGVFLFGKRLREERLTKTLVRFLSVAGALVMLGFWAAFNKIVNGSPFALGWNAGLFWPPPRVPQLPYFFPLRYGSVAAFTFSFIVPVAYMAILFHAFEARMHRCAALAVGGLVLFFGYARYPFTGPLLLASLPLLFVFVLWLTKQKPWPRLCARNAVAVLCGMQAALLCAWSEEQWKMGVQPSDFSVIVYVIFILAALGIFAGLVFLRFRPSYAFAVFQLALVSLMALAWFKLVVYDYRADLARSWFKALGILTMVQPLLWPLLRRLSAWAASARGRLNARLGTWWPDILIVLAIAGVVWIPDIEAMTAHIFMGEYFHHTDHFVMAPVWAMEQGGVPNIDARSQYGMGSIAVFRWLMKWQGGISYTHFFTALLVMCTVYFVLVYVFLRQWLSSRALAVACWMMAFKAHIAFELAYPFVYTYPQSSVGRQCFDIIWALFMLKFIDQGRRRWLAGASLTAGAALWYVPSTGFYLCAAHAVVTAMTAIRSGQAGRRLAGWVWPLGLMTATAVILYVALCGVRFFQPDLWRNMADFLRMYMLINTSPLTGVLANKQYLDFIVFCLMVFIYLGTMIKVGIEYLAGGGNRRDWLAFGISVYGLGLLEHYVVLSIGNNYYGKSLPFFCLCFYWLEKAIRFWPAVAGRRLSWALAGVALVALVTNHSFISYPNVFNISRNPLVDQRVARPLPDGRAYFYHKHRFTPMPRLAVNSLGETDEGLVTEFEFKTHRQLIDRYHKDSDFSADAALIDAWTKPGEHVPLVSSNEVMVLIQARRPPFFYIFPLVETRPMRVRTFSSDLMQTREHLRRTIAQLDTQKPPVVFMEKIMLMDPPGNWYEENTPGLMGLLRYIKENYVPLARGQYLIAMKRKEQ